MSFLSGSLSSQKLCLLRDVDTLHLATPLSSVQSKVTVLPYYMEYKVIHVTAALRGQSAWKVIQSRAPSREHSGLHLTAQSTGGFVF